MDSGEILFIIAPSNQQFKEITKQSIQRHVDLNALKTFGFYIFEEHNKKEWNVCENKYLNIINVCENYKKYYDMAVVLSGNIFFHTNSIYIFIKLIQKIKNLFSQNKSLIAGYSYHNDRETFKKISYENLDSHVVLDPNNEYHTLKKIFQNKSNSLIDFDFCFINMNELRNSIPIFEFFEKSNIKIKNQQFLINNILMENTIKLHDLDNIFFTESLCKQSLKSKIKKNKDVAKLVYKFTDDFFPLLKLNENDNINLINYYIFNRLYNEYKYLNKSKIDENLKVYIDNTFIKTQFVDNYVNLMLR